RDFAATYIEWLLDLPEDARALIANPKIHDAQTLASALQRPNEQQVPPREEPEMAKNKRPAEAPRGELNQSVIGYINEQIAAAEGSLRDYVDKWRSSSAEPRAPRASSAGVSRAAPPRRGPGEFAMAAAAGAVGGAVVALLI